MNAPTDERVALRPDCGDCVGLCCVALPFARSADFAIDKPGGMPCPNLDGADRCTIHARLPLAGFRGCTAFDCLGAGQQVTQVTLRGATWRDGSETATTMFAAFEQMRALHELRWYLAEARTRATEDGVANRIAELAGQLLRHGRSDAETLARLDIGALRDEVGLLLAQVSTQSRRSRPGVDLSHRDLAGQDLRGHDLAGANLRGALLIGADLRRQDLTRADLLGADLRAADLRWADLTDALFVLPAQLAAGRGDATTRIPAVVSRPSSWP